MRAAIDASVENGQVNALEHGVIEITTTFSIGAGIAEIRQHIAEVVATCAQASVVQGQGDTLVLDFGPANAPCNYQGRNYAGKVELSVQRTAERISVRHEYLDLTNGTVTINGVKTVDWSESASGEVVRHVVSTIGWDGPRGHVDHRSERTLTFHEWHGGPTQTLRIDGESDWQRGDDAWHMAMDQVEFRLIDPVPQAGSVTLINPADKEATLTFVRLDENTIEVQMSGGRRGDRTFHVTSAGTVSEANSSATPP
jgi:hypothetical protein